MKLKRLLVIGILLTTMTGCAKTLYDENKEVVKQPTTEQNLIANIVCKPNNKETIELYRETYKKKVESLDKQLKENEITKKNYEKQKSELVDVDKLVACEEFKLTSGGYEGLWTTIFVKPLTWLLLKLGSLVNNYGVSIILITLLLRGIMIPITRKTAIQSENMKKAKPELDKIEKKFAGKTDQASAMAKSQELMLVYKKYDINPVMGCVFAFIQIPLFFAFYEALSRTPLIFEGNFGPFQLGTSPMTALLRGEFFYVLLALFVIGTTYFSFKLNSADTVIDGDSQKQMNMMTNVMTVLISFTAFSLSTGIALYWIFNSGFTIIQNILVKRSKKNDRKNNNRN